MKLAETPTLLIKPEACFEGVLCTRGGRWEFCLDRVKDHFDIPEGDRYARFIAYDRPSKDRHHVMLLDPDRERKPGRHPRQFDTLYFRRKFTA